MKISEIFYSIQGEGPFIGSPTLFIRVGDCNLRCPWCDTKYALTEYEEMSIEEIIEQSKEVLPEKIKSPDNISITGGEPMLQQTGILKLLNEVFREHPQDIFRETRYALIETNGTIRPTNRFLDFQYRTVFCISPKFHEDPAEDWIYLDKFWWELNPTNSFILYYYFKFVIDTKRDLDKVKHFIEKTGNRGSVFLMPQGVTTQEIIEKLPWISDFALNHGLNVTPRLHILTWGNKRGR